MSALPLHSVVLSAPGSGEPGAAAAAASTPSVGSAQPEQPQPESELVSDIVDPPESPDSAPAEAAEEPQLDANRLHVYGVALELHTLCATLVSSLNRIVRDQLERASLSVVLNTAEASGRRSRRDKARYYAIARGSATEVAALLDVLERRHLASPAAIRTGRKLAIRVVQMLTRVNQKLLA
jgi:four helix bundle protein